MESNRKKPVVFIQGDKQFYSENKYAQNLLLKAISKGITDPHELKKISGLKTVANVFRTLDKMSIRKEYHAALTKANIDLDYVVNGIKSLCDESPDEKIRLEGFKTLMKSIGIDKYDIAEESAKSWEEAILEAERLKGIQPQNIIEAEYEVTTPKIPEKAQTLRDKELKSADELYGTITKQGPEKA